MKRSETTSAPRASAGRITSAACSAREAANSAASAQGAICGPLRTSCRTRSPSSVPPGSRVETTSRPRLRRCSSRKRAWVDLPQPSTPSIETNTPTIRTCVASSPAEPASSARTSSMPSLRAATRSSSSTTSPRASERTSPRARSSTRWTSAPPRSRMRSPGPRSIFHLAAQADVPTSVRRPDFDAEVNVVGSVRVLQAAGDAHVVFSSTGGAIYGECERPAREDDPRRPLAPYGVAKLAARGVPRRLEPPARDAAHNPSVRERVRAAAGGGARGRRGRDLPRRDGRRRGDGDLRGRRADARLRPRRRRRLGAPRRTRERAASSTSGAALRRPSPSCTNGAAP